MGVWLWVLVWVMVPHVFTLRPGGSDVDGGGCVAVGVKVGVGATYVFTLRPGGSDADGGGCGGVAVGGGVGATFLFYAVSRQQ